MADAHDQTIRETQANRATRRKRKLRLPDKEYAPLAYFLERHGVAELLTWLSVICGNAFVNPEAVPVDPDDSEFMRLYELRGRAIAAARELAIQHEAAERRLRGART